MNDGFRWGFGTESLRVEVLDHAAYADHIAAAIDAGYRHLDTSQHAGTESVVGEALRRSGVAREDVTVATKVHPRDLGPGDVARSVEESRDRLGVERIDLAYVHAPRGAYEPAGTLAAFDALVGEGIVGHVGVCHFTPDQIAEAVPRLESGLFAHQVERHPLLQQAELLALADEHDHWLVAASPLIRGFVGEITEIREVAARRGLTPAEVTLAWQHSDPRIATIPHSMDPVHIRENLHACGIRLEGGDRERIDGIDRSWRLHPWFGT